MPHVPKLTRKILDGLEHPDAPMGNYYLMESGGRDSLRGFGVRVLHTGMSYVVRWRKKPYTLGRVDHLPLERARELARIKINDLVQGRNQPAAMAGRSKTVAQLAELHLEKVIAPDHAPKTLEEYRRLWRLHILPRFGAFRLHEVTPELVLKMKHEMASRPVAANRALQQLAAAYATAVKLKWLQPGENPADQRTIDRYAEDPENRALLPEEYRRLWAAIREAEERSLLPARTVAALRLLLLTGARPHEILAAKVAWLELDRHPQIRWPRAKGDRPGRKAKGRSIWLGPAAVAVVQSISRPPGCQWLIPGDDPANHLVDIEKAWARICQIAGVSGATPKDV